MVASCRRGSRVRLLHGYGVSRRKAPARRVLAGAGVSVLAVFALLAAWVAIDFDGFFAQFHSLFFAAGTWTFSWDSLLICMYPPEFWVGMGRYLARGHGCVLRCLHYYRKAAAQRVNPKALRDYWKDRFVWQIRPLACAFVSRLRPRASFISAAPARLFTTGRLLAPRAARSCCASRTPIPSAPPKKTRKSFCALCAGSGLDWDRGPRGGR